MHTGYSIRRATVDDATAVARVHVDSWRTTYRGIVPDAFLDGMSYAESEARWRRGFEQSSEKYAMFVAQDETGRIVGFANGGPIRKADPDFDGELYAIYLLEEHQRRGLGRRLIRQVAGHLVQQGMHGMLIWALADNPACQFYAAMGGQAVREGELEIGGKWLKEVGYGWRDLAEWLRTQVTQH
ncbi:GNAT family N-acetyltransferase [Alicyclobacillus macrosporangiidus]|uniref:GNAT family N-acetyltransferase n=1 Tax=Alicyclobacillus macrosporangiidus TaxID=392015 RepID=UPI0026F1EBE9|nr:GNAT family N-acetyltransferase [Alicyclobacillus macrosporangiidus]